MAFAPTLTQTLDWNPGPRVLVAFPSLASGTQTVNVYRTAEGRTFKVRGGVNLFAVGGASVMDFECPVGVTASYQAEQFNAAGTSLGFTDQASTTIPASVVPDSSWVIVHQPLSPALSILGQLDGDTAADVVNTVPGSLATPEGGTVPLWIGGQRLGVSNMRLSVVAQSYADADEFRSMFGDYNTNFPAIVCVRTIPPVRFPRLLFAAVAELHETTDYINGLVTFGLTVTEAAPPSPGLILPTLRRIDIDAAYATRDAMDAAYATRFAEDSDYSLAGLAG